MAARTTRSKLLDISGVGLSCLCLLHCMALPLLVVSAPVLAVFSENEAIHKVLVLLALPVALLAIFTTQQTRSRPLIIAMLVIGISLLLAGAFVEALHDYETPLTVAGALFLSAGHIWRWFSPRAVSES
ncbi:MAG: MerC domain-containing protein [Pseudomonadota bacterium]